MFKGKRHVPFITLSEISPRVWITLSGCNFNCLGCFSIAKDIVGKPMTVKELVKLVEDSSRSYYGDLPKEIIITGGEPTLNKKYLKKLISSLRSSQIIIESNGYLLDDKYVDELIKVGLDGIMLDLKAFDEKIHKKYTGFSNKRILRNLKNICKKDINLIIKTIYIPGWVEEKEIKNIARFLSKLNPEIEYRINPYRPIKNFSREPTYSEMLNAYKIAKKYLKNVFLSKSCRRETLPKKKIKTWITVFPDGKMKRRSLNDYRKDNMKVFNKQEHS